MKSKLISEFEKIEGQLSGMLKEITVIAKKSPNDSLSTFKLNFVNELIGKANSILGKNYSAFDSFTQFDVDELPTFSDVVFVCSQYLECLEKLRADNIYRSSSFWYWIADGEKSGVITAPPKKINKR